MKSVTYLIVAALALAPFASAGKKNFVPGGTILDIQGAPHAPGGGPNPGKQPASVPRRVRDLLSRRAAINNQ